MPPARSRHLAAVGPAWELLGLVDRPACEVVPEHEQGGAILTAGGPPRQRSWAAPSREAARPAPPGSHRRAPRSWHHRCRPPGAQRVIGVALDLVEFLPRILRAQPPARFVTLDDAVGQKHGHVGHTLMDVKVLGNLDHFLAGKEGLRGFIVEARDCRIEAEREYLEFHCRATPIDSPDSLPRCG